MSILNSITKIYRRNRKRRNAARKRSILERQSANTPNPPAGIARRAVCEKVEISGANAWWLNKGNQSAGVVVYLHGGSYVTGPYREQWGYFANLCKRTGFAGLLVDYKLAPQFPFPHGLNDVIGIISTLAGQG